MWYGIGFFGHPEVSVGFITLLYAEKTLKRLRYEIIPYGRESVRRLSLMKISAGYLKEITSETKRNGVDVKEEDVKPISDHVPQHTKPLTDEQFGHYLAGLIDGDGHFSKIGQLIIVFSSPDAFLAYYIKSRLGFGTVRKIKDKNAYVFIISSKAGMLKISRLINGKLRSEPKFKQIQGILNHKPEIFTENFTINKSTDFQNHWLAGFTDADGSFQVKKVQRSTRRSPEIRVNFQIDQKCNDLLLIIKGFLGGNIGYRKTQDTYYYGSTSFGSARNVIKYFDNFHLQSKKHLSYLR